ncbi:LamG domain-containing protein [Puniceicoccus vermicola]|uniref:LamG domain-containing protein n=1 Tax=Puniceicoccus vermicola TaxID=388746 RepID=A0A7X1E410_9BACT|nr:LamG domain-containing protein [Puniceicoccus vermicola]MBC2601503.1 LamG domain-containing protein [Puniceicoccus vermicola]
MKRITRRSPRLLSCAALLVASSAWLPAQTLLLNYDFEGSGTTVTNAGDTSGANLTFFDSGGAASDLFSSDGEGVGGVGQAFDNSASTGMGSQGTGGRAQSDTSVGGSVGSLSSFTITGWFKTDGVPFEYGATLFAMSDGSTNGISLSTGNNENDGRIRMRVNGTATDSSAVNRYNTVSDWQFFAVTYDGTSSSNNVNFYVGTEEDALSLVSVGSLNAGVVESATGRPVVLGNNQDSNTRPFDGFLDDFRLYGESTGADGVLDFSEIEQIRASSIPELSSSSMVITIFAFAMVHFVRRRR